MVFKFQKQQYTSIYWPAEWLYSFWKTILYDTGQWELLCTLPILKHHTKNKSKIYCTITLTFTKNNRRICDLQSPTTSRKKMHQHYKRLLPYNSKTVFTWNLLMPALGNTAIRWWLCNCVLYTPVKYRMSIKGDTSEQVGTEWHSLCQHSRCKIHLNETLNLHNAVVSVHSRKPFMWCIHRLTHHMTPPSTPTRNTFSGLYSFTQSHSGFHLKCLISVQNWISF